MNPTENPPQSEPIFNIPAIIIALTIMLAGVHGLRSLGDPATDWNVLTFLAFVPARASVWLDYAGIPDILRMAFGETASRIDPERLPPQLAALLETGIITPFTVLSYGLLHGSFGHLLTNALWLVAFGSPVVRRIGAARFLLLIASATIGGAMAHWCVNPLAIAPLIGASAAVSGATAAAARFVFAPGIRFGELGDDEKVRAIRAEPLMQLLKNPRAFGFIAFWFIANFIFGSGVVPITGEETNIAWQAHIGGFVAGLLLFPLLDKASQR